MFTLPTKTEPYRIVHEDCVKVLRTMPDKCVDCVVTSPPYNQLGGRIPRNGTGKYRGKAFLSRVNDVGYEDDHDEDTYQEWLSRVVDECLRVCRGLVWVNLKVRYRNGVAIHPLRFLKQTLHSEIIWSRSGSMVQAGGRFPPSHESIYAFGTPHHWDDSHKSCMTVWQIHQSGQKPEAAGHPCPFPLTIPLRCIRASCQDDGVVLDPFAGSGTTGVAALQEGCRAVLIEKDERYIPVIEKRMRNALADGDLMPRRAFRITNSDSEDSIF